MERDINLDTPVEKYQITKISNLCILKSNSLQVIDGSSNNYNNVLKAPVSTIESSEVVPRKASSSIPIPVENDSSDSSNASTNPTNHQLSAINTSEIVSVKTKAIGMKSHSDVSAETKVSYLDPILIVEKSERVKEFLDSIRQEKEEIEEMSDMIHNAKQKLDFFISHIDYLSNALQDISKHSLPSRKGGNTYIKSMYRKKLAEFVSKLLQKVKRSLQNLNDSCEELKVQDKKIAEAFKKVGEFSDTSCWTADAMEKCSLKGFVDNLANEVRLSKSRWLLEIGQVSYIETDIEMLYDMYRRFSSVEYNNLISF